MRRGLIVVGVVILSACGNHATTGPSPAAETLEVRLQTAHFRILTGTTPEAAWRAAADRLEAEYPRILTGLDLSSLPVITVRIWQDDATAGRARRPSSWVRGGVAIVRTSEISFPT